MTLDIRYAAVSKANHLEDWNRVGGPAEQRWIHFCKSFSSQQASVWISPDEVAGEQHKIGTQQRTTTSPRDKKGTDVPVVHGQPKQLYGDVRKVWCVTVFNAEDHPRSAQHHLYNGTNFHLLAKYLRESSVCCCCCFPPPQWCHWCDWWVPHQGD